MSSYENQAGTRDCGCFFHVTAPNLARPDLLWMEPEIKVQPCPPLCIVPSMRTVRIHVGPLKTGTTSVQGMLEERRESLLREGFLYPQPRGDSNHTQAVLDFLSSCGKPSPLREAFIVAFSNYPAPWRKDAWDQLKEEVHVHDGPVVISSEILCYLPSEFAELFIAQLDADEVEVVAVRRRPSALVTSLHLQLMKLAPQPDFPDFVRTLFAELPAPGRSPHEFIDVRTVVNHWSDAGAAVTVIDALNGLSDATVVDTIEALTPGLTWKAPEEPSNTGMSGLGGHLWQAHCRAHPPKYLEAAGYVRGRMHQAFPETMRGPKPRLTAEAAKALDDYCAGFIDTLPQFEQLVEPLPSANFDMEYALRRMRRWQQRANLNWGAADLVRAMRGRSRIMKWPSIRDLPQSLNGVT